MLVNTPVVPVMLPVVKVTAPTVSEKAPMSNVPPFTVTAPDKALVTPTVKVPAVMVVSPAKGVTPVSVHVPVPALVKPPVPLATPLKVVLVLSPPAVRVNAPSDTAPAPANDPTVSLPVNASVAPVATVTALASPIPLPFTDKVPALIVVAPV